MIHQQKAVPQGKREIHLVWVCRTAISRLLTWPNILKTNKKQILPHYITKNSLRVDLNCKISSLNKFIHSLMNIIFMCVLQWSLLDPSQIPMLHWLAVGIILKYCFRGLFLVGLSKYIYVSRIYSIDIESQYLISHSVEKKILCENRLQCNFKQIWKKKLNNFVSGSNLKKYTVIW